MAEQKKTYQTPKLVTYGDVRVLTTRTNVPGGTDTAAGGHKSL